MKDLRSYHNAFGAEALADLPVNSKFTSDWSFLQMLRDRGRDSASDWLAAHYDAVGVRSSVNLAEEFL